MRTSIRIWLASVGVVAGAGWASVSGQSLPAVSIPEPMPLNKPQPAKPNLAVARQGVEKGKNDPIPKPMPMPTPPKTELPPVPELEAPTGLFPSNCTTCGDVNSNCADPGCAGDLIPGPKDPVWMSYSQLLLWFQPARPTVPLGFDPTTNRVLTNGEAELGMYYGYKIDGGMWVNHAHTLGVGADGFITEHRSKFRTFSGGNIARPFFDATTGTQIALAVSNDPLFNGALATANTARFASGGVNLRHNVAYNERWQIDISYGFRYYDVDESLVIYQRTNLPNAIMLNGMTITAGSPVQLRDRFYTRNQFWGGDIGAHLEWKHGITFLGVTSKLAFGSIHQITQINGETRSMTPNVTVPGALLAAGQNGDGNLGRFVTNRFGIATELGLKAGVNITKNTRLALGYNFYYLNNVARPGAQIDQTVNQRVVPVSPSFGALTGVSAPNVTFDREGFYAHGVALTMEMRY